MIDPSAGQLRFGSFVLDLARSELLDGARHVLLRRQAFDTLRYLIEHSGRVVSKTEAGAAVVTNSYWDVQTTGQFTSVGGTGLTDAQLKSGLPSGFDSTVWGSNPSVNNAVPSGISHYPHCRLGAAGRTIFALTIHLHAQRLKRER
jgi:hypothetical protein